MIITRDGKTYELTPSEIALAWEENMRRIWRLEIESAIERNSENIRFGDMSYDDFVDDCMDQMENYYMDEDWEDRVDEVVTDQATGNDIWVEEEDEEDD